MQNQSAKIKNELKKIADPKKAKILMRFFKTGKGEYGEGDKFLGVVVPEQRKIAKRHLDISFEELENLMNSDCHEHRFTAVIILTYQFEKADEKGKKAIFDFYYKNRKQINNWDLVDVSCHKIMGAYLLDKNRDILYKMARSKNMWDRRIAIVSTFAFIRVGELEDTLKISEILVQDEHDLIHKAVGWMLREVGKKDAEAERGFLRKYEKVMPRIMWRYAIERGVRP